MIFLPPDECWTLDARGGPVSEQLRAEQIEVVGRLLAGDGVGFDAYIDGLRVVIDEPLTDSEVETLMSLAARSLMPLTCWVGGSPALVHSPSRTRWFGWDRP